jgi:hypothetical protein
MKTLTLIFALLAGSLSHAALVLRTSGHVVKENKHQVVFETDRMRYLIVKAPRKGQEFKLRKISGNFYTLDTDVRRIKTNKVIKK